MKCHEFCKDGPVSRLRGARRDLFHALRKNCVRTSGAPPGDGAFTVIELLVVMAIIGVLAAFLLPVLSKAKNRAQGIACANSMKQIGFAFFMYAGDSHDQFPAPGSKRKYGPQPEDWIWWQQDRDVQQSRIAKYVASFNPALFTCPADTEAKALQNQPKNLPEDPYRYSYSLTSYDLEGTDPTNYVNAGMSTIISRRRKIFPFKTSDIRNPSGKIMLVEEDRATINDPRWVPLVNLINVRHLNRGNVVFADGHADAVRADFGTNAANSKPTF